MMVIVVASLLIRVLCSRSSDPRRKGHYVIFSGKTLYPHIAFYSPPSVEMGISKFSDLKRPLMTLQGFSCGLSLIFHNMSYPSYKRVG